MPDVRIVDLEIIKRFSLAVRQEYADADEVVAALEATLDEVRTIADGGGAKRTTRRTSRRKTTPAKKKGGSRAKAGAKKKSSSSRGTK